MIKILNQILDEAHKSLRGKALIAPAVIAAIVSGAVKIGGKVIADIRAKRAAKKVDEEKAAAKLENEKKANEQVEAAKGVVRAGDPTLAEKQRLIKESGANVVGQAKSSSQSTQEIINAAQGVQSNVDKANNAALGQAGERDLNARQLLAQSVTSAGRQRIFGEQVINREAQLAIDAIGANAQATADSVGSVTDTFTQAVGLAGDDAFSTPEGRARRQAKRANKA